MSELVTGDAVVLGLRPAKLPSRALAVVIDLVVVGVAFVLVSVGLAVSTATLDEAALAAVSVASFLLVLVGGPVAVETLSHGRSLGKLACGLRVVRDDGGPIRFRHALVRGAVGFVEILMTLGAVACVASLVSERGRRLGDVFAGTLVVRERLPAGRAAFVPPPPPWLVGRFAGLDLSAVPDSTWLAVRQCLTRVHQLDARVGQAMAERLAGELAGRTGAPVPEGVPAWAYLAAVVNERQTREAQRAYAAARNGSAGVGGQRAGELPVGGAPVVGGGPEGAGGPAKGEVPVAGGGPGVAGGPAKGEVPVVGGTAGGAMEGGTVPPAATGFVPPA
ncbi:RDD family protein [Streptomyces sp. NPDC058195]|uniref:RDD family protein n=1 Tax=Streptomyces sp. NPDC058195 TaxID=3346375 RepID=UPI0036E18C2D